MIACVLKGEHRLSCVARKLGPLRLFHIRNSLELDVTFAGFVHSYVRPELSLENRSSQRSNLVGLGLRRCIL